MLRSSGFLKKSPEWIPCRHADKLSNQNAKFEARNPKQTETLKTEIRNELVWKFVLFDHLDLFRIWDF